MLRVMLTPDDLTTPERAEITRRSVAMLNTGAWAFKREDALMVLGALVDLLRQQRAAGA